MISFCDCGTLKQTSTCPNCNSTSPLISKPKTQSRIFSPLPTASIQLETSTQQATIEMSCVKCGKEELSFRTAQLRSSDEGQTIFYHCWGCGYRFSVNS